MDKDSTLVKTCVITEPCSFSGFDGLRADYLLTEYSTHNSRFRSSIASVSGKKTLLYRLKFERRRSIRDVAAKAGV